VVSLVASEGFQVVIPARLGSTRLVRKPLVDIAGETMIVRVVKRACESGADQVIVATDHEDIVDTVTRAGYDAEMTRPDHASGSDRVMEVVARRGWSEKTIVINVQGDEPLIPPAVIRQLAEALKADQRMGAVTLCTPILAPEELADPDVVKLVRGVDHAALYFSRAELPHVRGHGSFSPANHHLRHIGVYGFRVGVLQRFVELPASPLEQLERLEQLRLLENAIRLDVLDACESVPHGVDTPRDVERVRALLELPRP